MLAHERIELANKIIARFKAVPFPKRNMGDVEELDIFVGKQGNQITIEDINVNRGLQFFSPEGFHYYLQAYLVNVLKYPEKIHFDAKLSLLNFLVGYYIVARLFTEKQKEVVLQFVTNYQYSDVYGDIMSNLPSNKDHFVTKQIMHFEELHEQAINFWKP